MLIRHSGRVAHKILNIAKSMAVPKLKTIVLLLLAKMRELTQLVF